MTTFLDLDATLESLAQHVEGWVATTDRQRARLLRRVRRATLAVADEWNARACEAKGYAPGSAEAGEEYFSGIGTWVRYVRTLEETLRVRARHGISHVPRRVTHHANGGVGVGIFPANRRERLIYGPLRAEVWIKPEDLTRTMTLPSTGSVALVLGAGNVASLTPRDILDQLFLHNRVVVAKANPVNDYLVPVWRAALAPLIDAGVVTLVEGDAEVGRALVEDRRVGAIHITGAERTYNTIVFGAGPEGEKNRRDDRPICHTPVSSELGNVTPIVVVPGRWTRRELRYQARHVATMLVNNASFNCLTPRVILTQAAWPQRTAFLDELAATLASLPTRRPYYPRATDARDALLRAHPEAESLGAVAPATVPWTMVRGLSPTRPDETCFTTEHFTPVIAETSLECEDAASFLAAATEFCNHQLWGTLCATVLVDERTRRNPTVARALTAAVADLRYGSVGVNAWHAWSFLLATTAWGGAPGSPRNDVQSGQGMVGNTGLLVDPTKSVVEGPFTVRPEPAWFSTHRNSYRVMRTLVHYEGRPRWRKLPALIFFALVSGTKDRNGGHADGETAGR